MLKQIQKTNNNQHNQELDVDFFRKKPQKKKLSYQEFVLCSNIELFAAFLFIVVFSFF